jgi:hypothetical protein
MGEESATVNLMSHHTIVLFMAHYLSRTIVEQFHSLKKSCSGEFGLKMLYDNSRKDFDPSSFESRSDYFLYDVNDIERNYRLLNQSSRTIVPGNCTFPMLLFADAGAEFRYLWRVEYDARFSGDWRLFFESFESNDSDLLGTTIFRYDFRPDWNWWGSLKAPVNPLEKKWLLRGFFPVFRLSKKACAILSDSYQSGWSGHDEVSIPTILNYNECSIEDIGGDGEFVKPGNRNRFYTNTPSAAGLAPGTFVYHPHACSYPDIPNMLYHPVKD